MSGVNRFGLVKGSGGARTTEHNFTRLAPDTPPLLGKPFADNLDEADRRFGVASAPRKQSPRRGRPPLARPNPALPLPPRTHVPAYRVGYGAALPPLQFTIRAGTYEGRADTTRRATSDALISAVECAFGVKRMDLLSARRNRAIAIPRQALCLLATEFTDWSLARIGLSIGGRDHTTIIHAVRKAQLLERSDNDFGAAIEQARELLRREVPEKEPRP